MRVCGGKQMVLCWSLCLVVLNPSCCSIWTRILSRPIEQCCFSLLPFSPSLLLPLSSLLAPLIQNKTSPFFAPLSKHKTCRVSSQHMLFSFSSSSPSKTNQTGTPRQPSSSSPLPTPLPELPSHPTETEQTALVCFQSKDEDDVLDTRLGVVVWNKRQRQSKETRSWTSHSHVAVREEASLEKRKQTHLGDEGRRLQRHSPSHPLPCCRRACCFSAEHAPAASQETGRDARTSCFSLLGDVWSFPLSSGWECLKRENRPFCLWNREECLKNVLSVFGEIWNVFEMRMILVQPIRTEE